MQLYLIDEIGEYIVFFAETHPAFFQLKNATKHSLASVFASKRKIKKTSRRDNSK
jgi:hypothetical protein